MVKLKTMLSVCMASSLGVANVAYSTTGFAPMQEYKHYVGTYGELFGSETAEWMANGKQFLGLRWKDDPFPVIAVGVEDSIRILQIDQIPRSERVFKHQKTEQTDAVSRVWFVLKAPQGDVSAFIDIQGEVAPSPGGALAPRVLQMMDLYLLCVPGRDVVMCARFSE